ncbi:hypothetical protein ACFL6X_01030 [Candidatus Latescibacterota bacterium]
MAERTEKGKRRLRDSQWQEVEEYRSLLEPPDRFDSGFTFRTVIGVIFISLIMTPGEMYLGLVTGGGIGAAAQWVTVILFLEVAKRSFTSLRRQEIYLLVYVASALVAREEGAFLDLLWRQYFVRSAEAEQFGISRLLPWWWSPAPDSPAIAERTFLHRDWLWPIVLLVVGTIVGRISWFTSGYVLFRLTSDRERLPFPTAPMSALSAMALAEESGQDKETWKWPVFSIGGAIGAVFGIFYVGIPTITEVMTGTKIMLIPIPFWDLTPFLGNLLPATPLGVTLNLGPILAGLLMPFWAVIGSFTGVMVHTFVSPLLHAQGYLPSWSVGMDTIRTQIATGIDFWKAFSIGITLAVTVISFYQLFATARLKRAEVREQILGKQEEYPTTCQHEGCNLPSEVRGYCLKHLGRGDFNVWVCVALFGVAAIYPIVLAKTLFPTLVGTGLLLTFFGIAFLYAPIMSFVSARLDGMIGKEVSIPYIHEAVIFLTGYRGVDIWFVPFPARNYGGHAEGFRVVELTGMRFTSLLKAELLMLPIVFAVSLMYWSFLWRMGPIPSDSYPYAQLMWPLKAFDQALFYSSTMYSRTWREGEEVEGAVVSRGEAVWSPSNLQGGRWWYWRARVTREVGVPDPVKRQYGDWSAVGYFYADFRDGAAERGPPEPPPEVARREQLAPPPEGEVVPGLAAPVLQWPPLGVVISSPNPNFRVTVDVPDSVDFYFEVDRLVSFDGEFLQRSTDVPLLFKVLWRDLTYTGDRRDNDGDGRVDEELHNGVDDDGDGMSDEDTGHPLDGRKWPIIIFGAGFGLVVYFVLSILGLPIFLIWGYVQSVNGIPHNLLPQIIGALLARFYFWKRYGKQEWRRYAMVLSVGFGVGMSLIGMFCAALAMVSKAVSSLVY